MIQRLQENEVSSEELAQLSENDLESRTNLILKVAALANHISLHAEQLELYGSKRSDINRLKEETNAVIQSAEALLNSLQINIRALQQRREEQELKLRNLSPENEAEKAKQQTELMKLQAKQQTDQNKLLLANKIADQRQKQHIDKQISKARDRQLKRDVAVADTRIKELELLQNERLAAIERNTLKEEKGKKT